MDTPGKDEVISASTVSSVNLEETKKVPPPGFYWVGTKKIHIYDEKILLLEPLDLFLIF